MFTFAATGELKLMILPITMEIVIQEDLVSYL